MMINNLLRRKKVAIIGGGPVGLTMAKLLQQQGVEVNVYERDKSVKTRISGGTLDLLKNSGQKALKKAGLLESYYTLSRPTGRTITNEKGKVFVTKKLKPKQYHDNPEIDRKDLREIFVNSMTDDTVIWDRKFTELTESDGKWLLHFDNETTATADVVIGANGGTSNLKKYITNDKNEYTGTFLVQGEVHQPELKCPEFYRLCNDNMLVTFGKGNMLISQFRNDNVLNYFVTFRKLEKWIEESGINFTHTETVIDFLLGELSHWHGIFKQLFQSTSYFMGLPMQKASIEKPWKKNRSLPITLIGDAAHVMPPFAGKGVNTGLMDALILSENLTKGNFDTIQAAINDYEQQMFVYAKKAQRETSENEIQMHSPHFSFLKFSIFVLISKIR